MIKSRRMRWTGHVERMGEMKNAYKILVGKPRGKTALGRPKHKWRIILTWISGIGGCGLDSPG
jgi:hypothetical protein